MAGKNQTCPGCGYKIKRPDGFLINHQGKSWHIGCLEQYLKAKWEMDRKLQGESKDEPNQTQS